VYNLGRDFHCIDVAVEDNGHIMPKPGFQGCRFVTIALDSQKSVITHNADPLSTPLDLRKVQTFVCDALLDLALCPIMLLSII